MSSPEIILIGGCNGAGKTTLAFELLGKGLGVYEFVNADEIARGLNPLNPASQNAHASRLMIERVNTLIKSKKSFAMEGTLAGLWQHKILTHCKAQGYTTRLVYVWLPSIRIAQARVTNRVQQGGHDIPKDVIARRYKRGLANLHTHYLPLADHAMVLNGNAINVSDRLIAQKYNDTLTVLDPEKWSALCLYQ